MSFMNIRLPGLVIDKSKCMSNIKHISKKFEQANIDFRPHFKTHQSHEIGRWFRQYGVSKITVSSVSMADYFIKDGWKDIFISTGFYPAEIAHIKKLTKKSGICLTVTGTDSARILSQFKDLSVDVMIKIDTGYNRSGIKWDDIDSIKETVKYLNSNAGLQLKGLFTHAGNTYNYSRHKDIINCYNESVERLNYCREQTGNTNYIISVGDTPSATVIKDFKNIDEARPGNFVFYDLMQLQNNVCTFDNISIILVCPLIDIRRKENTLIIHGGAVHFSKEHIEINKKKVFGKLVTLRGDRWIQAEDNVYITSLSQEHGIIDCSGSDILNDYKIGDLIGIIPVHSCLAANAIGEYMIIDDETNYTCSCKTSKAYKA